MAAVAGVCFLSAPASGPALAGDDVDEGVVATGCSSRSGGRAGSSENTSEVEGGGGRGGFCLIGVPLVGDVDVPEGGVVAAVAVGGVTGVGRGAGAGSAFGALEEDEELCSLSGGPEMPVGASAGAVEVEEAVGTGGVG